MVTIHGPDFVDAEGRRLLLRGVNLSGGSKLPSHPDGATYHAHGFYDHAQVSFTGRPFPLEEAAEHLRRLRAWGMTCLRLLVTWEAVEHAGPGQYDREYLAYLRAVVEKAGEYGMLVIIDPHQDVWSRFTGGDGAPGWTLAAAGLDITALHQTGAAFLHQINGDPLPRMIWNTNTYKLACATMFTLFFGGREFAPRTCVDDLSIQDYLQQHYFNAMRQVAQAVAGCRNVIGFEVMNEPSRGYIGLKDLNDSEAILRVGETPTPWQGIQLASGYPQRVDVMQRNLFFAYRSGRRWLNTACTRAWLPGRECIWREHGVWDLDSQGKPRLLKPGYFASTPRRAAKFSEQFFKPFINGFARAIRTVLPDMPIGFHVEVGKPPPLWDAQDAQNIFYSPHWYDGTVLILKRFTPWVAGDVETMRPVFGQKAIRRSFARQLGHFKSFSGQFLNHVPTLVGEFGISFDLNHKRAYTTGDFSDQVHALDRTYRALDQNLLAATLWNYTPENNNARGDNWNDEDLSIFSRDQQTNPEDINSGGRGLPAVIRPYPKAIAGELLSLNFDILTGSFEFSFRHDAAVVAPTLVYLPAFHYGADPQVEVSDGRFEWNPGAQELQYWPGSDREIHRIRVCRKA